MSGIKSRDRPCMRLESIIWSSRGRREVIEKKDSAASRSWFGDLGTKTPRGRGTRGGGGVGEVVKDGAAGTEEKEEGSADEDEEVADKDEAEEEGEVEEKEEEEQEANAPSLPCRVLTWRIVR